MSALPVYGRQQGGKCRVEFEQKESFKDWEARQNGGLILRCLFMFE